MNGYVTVIGYRQCSFVVDVACAVRIIVKCSLVENADILIPALTKFIRCQALFYDMAAV